jgi:hypothetical protein
MVTEVWMDVQFSEEKMPLLPPALNQVETGQLPPALQNARLSRGEVPGEGVWIPREIDF